jgi:predicted TPR repeat methyltransferase
VSDAPSGPPDAQGAGAGPARPPVPGEGYAQANALRPGEAAAFYDRWAALYDAEVAGLGYATPARVAAALVAAGADPAAPVLDFGCGTGLLGRALREAGFAAIDGWDVSPGMIEAAAARGVYRALATVPPAPPYPAGPQAAIAAAGAFGQGHAPPEAVDALLRLLPPGGLFAFNFNDRTDADPAYAGRLNDWIDCGAVEVVTKDYGPHLPGAGVGATVYVLRRR